MTKIFMCPPDYYFSIDYEINPWMKKGTACANNIAVKKWEELKGIIQTLGAEVVTMKPKSGLPDIVFTANAALIYKNKAVMSRFMYKERRPEEKLYADFLATQGFDVVILPEGMPFEGAGDALFSGETLYSGYIPRSDISSHTYIANFLNIRIISLELSDKKFYHLDTCFCPLTNGYLLYYPEAFDEYGNKVIENNFSLEKRIPVNEEEALRFSCNAVNIDNSIIMNNTTDRLKKALKDKGFNTYEVELDEFMKAGGSAKCLTLKLFE
jgi:N-dimethylarginine dimethylaminohydrolase